MSKLVFRVNEGFKKITKYGNKHRGEYSSKSHKLVLCFLGILVSISDINAGVGGVNKEIKEKHREKYRCFYSTSNFT